jgi:uncharacterized membrane protein
MSKSTKISVATLLGLGGIIAFISALISNNAIIIILLILVALAAEVGFWIMYNSIKRK